MKQSKLYMPMVKDVSAQAVAISHIYALKAGLIHQTAAGIYSYLPMGTKVLKNIEVIIREELEKIEASEVILPLLEPKELWEKTSRWQSYGDELFRVVDRRGSSFALAPTHEEVITELVKNNIKSYKKYPVNLFQIGTKMRDELRPRFGLLRAREFVMMDGYSFHTDSVCLKETYDNYYRAYCNIFARLGLEYKIVAANNGQMGGNFSHEFMCLAAIGEDTIAYIEDEEIAYNIEVAPIYYAPCDEVHEVVNLNSVNTASISKIDAVAKFFDVSNNQVIKAVAFEADNHFYITFTKGNRTLNQVKVENYFGVSDLKFAKEAVLKENNIEFGFIGPIGLPDNVSIVLDNELLDGENLICGSNEVDFHTTGIDGHRDLSGFNFSDICLFEEGDFLNEAKQEVKFTKGIEIGHTFALGNKYPSDLGVLFENEKQEKTIPSMGSYGLGVSRIISAIIEQNHDDKGMVLPSCIAPYALHLIALDYGKNEDQTKFTDELYKELTNLGIKVLLDDRNERPGIKFTEADILGLPIQVIVGRKFMDGIIEFKYRSTNEKEELSIEALLVKVARGEHNEK